MFPDELNRQDPLGKYGTDPEFVAASIAIQRASNKRDAADDAHAPKQVECRGFLERQTHEAVCMRRLIKAMLDPDESACGGSEFLLRRRGKFQEFFDTNHLPDPSYNGWTTLETGVWSKKFLSSVHCFYHHVSEKHNGELIELQRECLFEGPAPHPSIWDAYTCNFQFLPDVHSPQFFAENALPQELRQKAITFFKDKWWRNSAASGAFQWRDDFIREMWMHRNTVWAPTNESNHWMSNRRRVTFHSLDSLVWHVVHQLWPELQGGEPPSESSPPLADINFSDVYLFYCRCVLLARARAHSTSGAEAKAKLRRRNNKN